MDKTKKLFSVLKDLKEHEVMRNHITMRVGGVADFYYEAKTIDDLVKAVKIAYKINIPYFVLGNGSNIIFSDFGFPGLVIKNSTSNIAFMAEKSQAIVDSGGTLSKLILDAASNNFSGLEFLYGVPGTIGGAVYNNAGAWGQSIGDFVKSATLLIPPGFMKENPNNIKEHEIIQVPGEWLEFKYRSSKLKRIVSYKKPIILSLRIQLAQNRQEEIMRRLNIFKKTRKDKQPIGQSAGSVFKNPIPKELQNVTGAGSINMPDLPKERTAGYMLEKSGAKRMHVGSARVASKHANFVINTGDAKAQEVRQLIEQMRRAVKVKFDVNLEEEIEYIGQW